MGFGIYDNFDGQRFINVGVEIHGTEAIGMAKDRNLGVFFDVSHQLVGATGNDQVDV